MKKVKILVVGRLFQSELALLTSFENVELHVFETYDLVMQKKTKKHSMIALMVLLFGMNVSICYMKPSFI